MCSFDHRSQAIPCVKHDQHIEVAIQEEVANGAHLVFGHVICQHIGFNREFCQKQFDPIRLNLCAAQDHCSAANHSKFDKAKKQSELVGPISAQCVQMTNLIECALSRSDYLRLRKQLSAISF